MKSQNSKKPNLKITLDKKSVAQLSNQYIPSNTKCSQKTKSSHDKTTTSSSKQQCFKFQDSFSTPNPSTISDGERKSIEPYQSQLIKFLIQENLQLQKQNSDKDQIITKLLTSKNPIVQQRAHTSNTERKINKNSLLEQSSKKNEFKKPNSPLGFTFYNTDQLNDAKTISSQPITKSHRTFPKEFQIEPKQRKFFI